MSPEKILILTAIPDGLRLDQEIRDIVEAIRRAVKRDKWEIQVRTAVRPQDIRRALAEEQPSIVHFCGHGMEDAREITRICPRQGVQSCEIRFKAYRY